MVKFRLLKLADYSVWTVGSKENRSFTAIIADRLVFTEKCVNPFCVMMISDVEDTIIDSSMQTIDKSNFTIVTMSDGNMYICKENKDELIKRTEATMDTSGLPF